MKRQTQRIIAVGTLALAGGAFCVDRFVLGYGGPQGAAAATAPAGLAAAEAPKPRVAQPTAADAGPEVSVSKRLAGLKERMPAWGPQDERDAMTIPASWHIDPLSAAEKAAPATAGRPEAPKFALSAVVGGSNGMEMHAVINGRTVQIGDQIEGYTVQSIKGTKQGDPATVVLKGAGGEVSVESARLEGSLTESVKPEAAKAAHGKR